ncbi:anti-sigma factor family protein [Actinoplanes sp. RD1]|uniref:anti-sigma factor family protein n=1 Tax=Actinoplanes sp. RD1 TaxID=3064538 RepID=UPI0027425276|nr:zf-HC2 domain-containing protein [Actinoplanes sp. RD1]
MRCDHEHDDGAYVLGALSPAERVAYERHLATCSFCREAVADIAVLPGLLGRLDAADFERLMSATPPPPVRRVSTPELMTAAQTTRREERKRVRWRVLGTALAAACLALVAGIGAVFWMGRSAPPAESAQGPTVFMTPSNDLVPVDAQINIAGAPGGTRVNLVCAYNKGDEDSEPYTIRLMAYGPDDESEQLGSWIASPGKEFSMSGVTHFTTGMLNRLALVRNDGRTLLVYDIP